MVLIIINYAVRIMIILIGVLFLTGIIIPGNFENKFMMQIMGGIFILWGIYRIIIYRMQLKRYNREKEDE